MTAPPVPADDVRATLEQLRDHAPSGTGPRCAVERLTVRLVGQDREVAAVVWGACDDRSIPPGKLAQYLESKFGAHVSAYTIRRHRRRLATSADVCRCPR